MSDTPTIATLTHAAAAVRALAAATTQIRQCHTILTGTYAGAATDTAPPEQQTGPEFPAELTAHAAATATDMVKLLNALATHMLAGVPEPLRHRGGEDPLTTFRLTRQNVRAAAGWMREAADALSTAAELARHLTTPTPAAAQEQP